MIHEIAARRSTRRFIKKNIPEEDLHALLEAASWAPSEHNEQPWRFVVVCGDARKEVVRALKEGIKRNRSDKAAILERGMRNIYPPRFIRPACWNRHRSSSSLSTARERTTTANFP